MKKVLLLCLTAMFALPTFAQQNDKAAAKEQKQMEKEKKKAQKEAQEMALFSAAVLAMQNGSFVLEADRVEFKRGTFVNVISTTNFVMQDGDKATVQLSFQGAAIGPNGIGGLTVDGDVSGAELKQDKKGNYNYSFKVNGVGISALITINLPKGSNYCTATVTPNFNNNRTSFTGHLKPKARAAVHKGMAL
ncbi:MAG: DUF4251 domain-containing protein [Bacteroidales bacterium]|nr:DUF4251 domain-containing protein [Bacteroidales bacterium]